MLKFTGPRGAMSPSTFHASVLCGGLKVMARLLCYVTAFSHYRVKNTPVMNPCAHIFMDRTLQ